MECLKITEKRRKALLRVLLLYSGLYFTIGYSMLRFCIKLKISTYSPLRVFTPHFFDLLLVSTTICGVSLMVGSLFCFYSFFYTVFKSKRKDVGPLNFQVRVYMIFQIFLMIVNLVVCYIDYDVTYDYINLGFTPMMGMYRDHPKVKNTIDKLQISYKCCGSDGYTDWFSIPWSDYYDPANASMGYYQADDVPFSCCDVYSLRPCINHKVHSKPPWVDHKPHSDLTLYKTGCKEAVRESFLRYVYLPFALSLFAAIVFYLGFILLTFILHTSLFIAMKFGDMTSTTPFMLSECMYQEKPVCTPMQITQIDAAPITTDPNTQNQLSPQNQSFSHVLTSPQHQSTPVAVQNQFSFSNIGASGGPNIPSNQTQPASNSFVISAPKNLLNPSNTSVVPSSPILNNSFQPTSTSNTQGQTSTNLSNTFASNPDNIYSTNPTSSHVYDHLTNPTTTSVYESFRNQTFSTYDRPLNQLTPSENQHLPSSTYQYLSRPSRTSNPTSSLTPPANFDESLVKNPLTATFNDLSHVSLSNQLNPPSNLHLNPNIFRKLPEIPHNQVQLRHVNNSNMNSIYQPGQTTRSNNNVTMGNHNNNNNKELPRDDPKEGLVKKKVKKEKVYEGRKINLNDKNCDKKEKCGNKNMCEDLLSEQNGKKLACDGAKNKNRSKKNEKNGKQNFKQKKSNNDKEMKEKNAKHKSPLFLNEMAEKKIREKGSLHSLKVCKEKIDKMSKSSDANNRKRRTSKKINVERQVLKNNIEVNCYTTSSSRNSISGSSSGSSISGVFSKRNKKR